MNVIAIPKQIVPKSDIVMIPRKEYEALLHFRTRTIKEVVMTQRQKLAFQKARKNLAQGKFLTIHDLKRKLGTKN